MCMMIACIKKKDFFYLCKKKKDFICMSMLYMAGVSLEINL